MALPPRRSAVTDINAGYADKIPALPYSNRGAPRSVEIRLPGMPLVAGGQDVAQGDGLVGHDAVDAQVEQPLHGRALVDGPGVDLQAERLGPADERLRGHRGGHLDAADPATRQPVGQ